MSDHFRHTVRFIEAVEQTRSAAEVEDCLLSIAASFGLTSLFGGIVPTRALPSAEMRSRIVFQRLPSGWLDRYESNGYVFRDPIIQRLSYERMPFTWHEGYERCPQHGDVRLIQGEASEFGLRDGYVVPISTMDDDVAALSFGGPGKLPDSADLSVLNFAATYAVGRHLHHIGTWRRRVSDTLTPREWDCLLWAGEGKTDWEISVILGISRSTVTKHITTARAKLGAVNKAHAIATAIRAKLIL
ncbi:MAG: LuxR family transcriptional regulator [Nitrobacter sp.]